LSINPKTIDNIVWFELMLLDWHCIVLRYYKFRTLHCSTPLGGLVNCK